MGNVLVTVNDKKLGISANNNTVDYFNPQVVSAQDYYPFGMLQPGRSLNVSGYRYGFNGKENDNEVKGEGEQQDYGMRVYDTRLGKFLSVDPLANDYPWYTPYQFAGNGPIANIDLDGGEPKPSTKGTEEGKSEPTSEDVYNARGDWTDTKKETFFWHGGGLQTGLKLNKEKNTYEPVYTTADWYTSQQYVEVLSKSYAVKALASNLGLFNYTSEQVNSVEINKGQQELKRYVGGGLNESAASHLIGAAQKAANENNYFTSGHTYPSPVNVEDLLGVGALLKEGLSLLGGKIASAAGTEVRAAMFSLNEGYGMFGKSGLRIRSYKIEALYANPRAGRGMGTFFSRGQMNKVGESWVNKKGGTLLRLDYGPLHSGGFGLHTTIRLNLFRKTVGSTAQRTWYPPFNIIKK